MLLICFFAASSQILKQIDQYGHMYDRRIHYCGPKNKATLTLNLQIVGNILFLCFVDILMCVILEHVTDYDEVCFVLTIHAELNRRFHVACPLSNIFVPLEKIYFWVELWEMCIASEP